MTQAAAQLDYAPADARRRRKRVRLAVLIVAGVVLVVALKYGWPSLARHVQVIYWQRQCLAYTAPPERIVYESDPNSAALLMSSPNYVSDTSGAAWHVTPAWQRFAATAGWAAQTNGNPFLHERRLPDGTRRLVAVDLIVLRMADQTGRRWASFGARLIEPGHVFSAPDPVAPCVTRGDGTSIVLAPDASLRVYAGQVDPNNPSRFTIDYDVNGVRHTINGRLSDGDAVELELADGPEALKRDMKKALEE